MSLKLRLETQPEVPLEADCLSPDRVQGLDAAAIAKLKVFYGNQQVELGEFFAVDGSGDEAIHIEGDLSRVKHVGSGMTYGHLKVEGNVGAHLGAGMSGGRIDVSGDSGDWVGPEMSGGRIVIHGSAGHMVGSGYRGSKVGIRGGEIIVFGNAGNEIGNTMRNGLIAIGGDAGDFVGVGMLAGTIIVLGQMGIRTGAGMKRGTIVSMQDIEPLPTFSYDCQFRPTFIRVYLQHLRALGMHVDERYLTGAYRRWSGDAVELNRGECLLFAG